MTRQKQPKSPDSVARDAGRIRCHVLPLLGHIRARDLTRGHVQKAADAIAAGRTAGTFGKSIVRGGRGTAARTIQLFGGIWRWAQRRELVGEGANPCHGVDVYRGPPKDRVITPAELARLGATLKEARAEGSPGIRQAADIIKPLASTGLRRNEGAKLRFNEIDWAGHCLRLESSKTGRSVRVIGKAPLRLLEIIASTREPDEQVGNAPNYLKILIAGLFNAAGLPDARSHDLRRTFASVGADLGYGDGVIGELLGHARKTVTGNRRDY